MPDKILWLTDRSRTTLDWTCPRKRYLNYHYAGTGVTPSHLQHELFLGTILHDGLAAIATQHAKEQADVESGPNPIDIDTIATVASKGVFSTLMEANGGDIDAETYANEQASLVEGLLRGFYKFAWPSLISRYPRIISIEEEMTFPLDNSITFMSRPDLVLSDTDGNWVYVEYKSTSSKQEAWVNQWNTAVQIHSTIRAIENTLGTAPSSVIVQGLYKGYVSYGRQNSPFCYAYHRQGTPPFSYPETLYEYRAGFKKIPAWTLDGGIKTWVDGMDERLLQDQFPQTPPIYIKDALIDSFFEQRLLRETEIMEAVKVISDDDMPEGTRQQFLNGFFPQRFDQCNPSFGKGCSYRQACFGSGGNLLDMGWTRREPHHTPEMEQFAQELKNEA